MAQTLHFKIALIQSDPLIWRSFQVPADYRMDRFHQVIQIVMGWNNSHLHEFCINRRTVGMLYDEEFMAENPTEDETKLYLFDFMLKPRDTLSYLYDFGDHWEHILYLEFVSNREVNDPVCTDGGRACPPDDCGGVHGYGHMLEELADENHPEHESWVTWLPEGFHPEKFSIDETNQELARFGAWHRKHPRKKSTPWHQI